MFIPDLGSWICIFSIPGPDPRSRGQKISGSATLIETNNDLKYQTNNQRDTQYWLMRVEMRWTIFEHKFLAFLVFEGGGTVLQYQRPRHDS
jgi:hypothetical protein